MLSYRCRAGSRARPAWPLFSAATEPAKPTIIYSLRRNRHPCFIRRCSEPLGENKRKEALPLEFTSVIIRLINNEGMKQKKQLTVQNRWMRMASIIPAIATHAFEGKQKTFFSGSLNGRPPVLPDTAAARRRYSSTFPLPAIAHFAQPNLHQVKYARRNLSRQARANASGRRQERENFSRNPHRPFRHPANAAWQYCRHEGLKCP